MGNLVLLVRDVLPRDSRSPHPARSLQRPYSGAPLGPHVPTSLHLRTQNRTTRRHSHLTPAQSSHTHTRSLDHRSRDWSTGSHCEKELRDSMASINDLATAAIATSAATGGQAGDALPVTTPPAGVVRGAFIAFEGLDRSGKTTQVKLLEQRLIEEGKKVKVIRFPDRTTPIGQMIDAYLKSSVEMEDHVIHLLFSANRWEAVKNIQNLLASGYTVICDRYYHSGIVYSAAKQNPHLNLHWARQPEIGLPRPDLVLFLDLEEAVARERGGWGGEVYEKAEFQKRVRELFWGLSLGRVGPDGGLGEEGRVDREFRQEEEDLVVVDAGGTLEDVAEEIWRKIGPRVEAVEKGEAGSTVRVVS
ncbi:hypothetical protein CaCOL14_004790 [Colletotrichum acutatum]